DPAVVDSENLFEMPGGTGTARPQAFIVPQPHQREGRDRRDSRSMAFNNKNGKKRKKGRQEPQQPPQ
ncbi:MAG TPA: hypothetical protein VF690_02860, partial [Hymenobacter sp.]